MLITLDEKCRKTISSLPLTTDYFSFSTFNYFRTNVRQII